MPRQRLREARLARSRAPSIASRSNLADVHGVAAGRSRASASAGSSCPTTPTTSPSTSTSAARPSTQVRASTPARTSASTPMTAQSCSATPLTSKKSTSRSPAAPVLRCGEAGPGDRGAARFAAAREARADFEEAHVAACRDDDCGSRRRPGPGSRLGRSVVNFSDSGLASATGAGARRRTAPRRRLR